MGKITVIDAPCGVGKSSWAIQYINDHPEKSFVYCAPFLPELERIQKSCGEKRFWQPGYEHSKTKLEDFNRILSTGHSVAVTHMTFLNANTETYDLLHEGDYTLILDEELEVIVSFNDFKSVCDNPKQVAINDANMNILLNHHMITIDPSTYKVSWNDVDYGDDAAFSEVERLAKMGQLYCSGNSFLIAVFPPEMFTLFSEIYACTYLSDSSCFRYYCDIFKLSYEKVSVFHDDERGYFLGPYSPEADMKAREKCRDLVHLCDLPRLHRKRQLTANWYKNAVTKKEVLDQLKNDLKYYFKTYLTNAKAENGDIMWTCYKGYKERIWSSGLKTQRSMTKEERNLPDQEREALERKLSCFVSNNAKASNEYKERWALAYLCNMYMHSMMARFFRDLGVQIDEGQWALGCFLQWMYRSRLRDDQPIELYLPSARMQKLFRDWLAGL